MAMRSVKCFMIAVGRIFGVGQSMPILSAKASQTATRKRAHSGDRTGNWQSIKLYRMVSVGRSSEVPRFSPLRMPKKNPEIPVFFLTPVCARVTLTNVRCRVREQPILSCSQPPAHGRNARTNTKEVTTDTTEGVRRNPSTGGISACSACGNPLLINTRRLPPNPLKKRYRPNRRRIPGPYTPRRPSAHRTAERRGPSRLVEKVDRTDGTNKTYQFYSSHRSYRRQCHNPSLSK